MDDRPILFSGPMVRALIAGNKTQTRRMIKPQPTYIESSARWRWPIPKGKEHGCDAVVTASREWHEYLLRHQRPWPAVSDRLWVREAWTTGTHLDRVPPREISPAQSIGYLADEHEGPWLGRLRPGMHMPRWASRLTLTVTDVRVQRLQEISREDAIAEGLIRAPYAPAMAIEMGCNWGFEGDSRHGSPVSAYAALWDSLNAARAPWESNPWVAAYTFSVEHRNIDEARDG